MTNDQCHRSLCYWAETHNFYGWVIFIPGDGASLADGLPDEFIYLLVFIEILELFI